MRHRCAGPDEVVLSSNRESPGSVQLATWKRDPKPVRTFVALAEGEGLRPASIDQGRGVLIRYNRFLKDRYGKDVDKAGWKEFAAYKVHLGQTGIAKSTISGYLAYISTYFRLKAEATQSTKAFDTYVRTRLIGRVWRRQSEHWKPFSREVLARIVRAADAVRRRGGRHREDYVFIMALLYTGARAQLYGLRVANVDFKQAEVRVPSKGGRPITVPLHPRLCEVLRKHLRQRRYESPYMFRFGADPQTRVGQKCNRQNAWRTCKRIQEAAGLAESVHPHRFRVTVATEGRRAGLEPQFVQAILGHRFVGLTLDLYTGVDMEDLKQEFSKVDFTSKNRVLPKTNDERRFRALLDLAPKGKEAAWEGLVRKLMTVAGIPTGGDATNDITASRSSPRGEWAKMQLASELTKYPPILARVQRNAQLARYAGSSKAQRKSRRD